MSNTDTDADADADTGTGTGTEIDGDGVGPAVADAETANENGDGNGNGNGNGNGTDPEREPTGGSDAYETAVFWGSLAFGLLLAVGAVWFVGARGVWHEALLRVRPTLAGGGVGADWVAGVTNDALGLLISVIHVADILIGLFILLLVFVHWASFHRLAARMRSPDGEVRETAVADGGEAE